MPTMMAAKAIWELCNREVSNLSVQKSQYMPHMMQLGAGHGPMVGRTFEAWNYGPGEPDLYHELKAYSGRHVPDIFPVNAYAMDHIWTLTEKMAGKWDGSFKRK